MATKTEETIVSKLSEPLSIDEIEFRIQSISEKGYATILAYKDARVDMNRLDEVCGDLWQDQYELIDGQLFCSIGVKVKNEWVWRQDVGTESNTEKTKGRASDAFKRAGFRWGIGRELYDYPRIVLQLKGVENIDQGEKPEFTVKTSNNKKIGTSSWGLKLDKWTWIVTLSDDGKTPKRLIGKDQNSVVRFDSNKDFNGLPRTTNKTPPKNEQKPAKKKLSESAFKSAMESIKADVLTKALTTYDLTPSQLKDISERIRILKAGTQEKKEAAQQG